MSQAVVQWFLRDSHTARVLKRFAHSQSFSDCPVANLAVAVALVASCVIVVLTIAGDV